MQLENRSNSSRVLAFQISDVFITRKEVELPYCHCTKVECDAPLPTLVAALYTELLIRMFPQQGGKYRDSSTEQKGGQYINVWKFFNLQQNGTEQHGGGLSQQAGSIDSLSIISSRPGSIRVGGGQRLPSATILHSWAKGL